jgi:hypothetical protein
VRDSLGPFLKAAQSARHVEFEFVIHDPLRLVADSLDRNPVIGT